MPITYKEAKSILSQYAGRGGMCPDNEEVDLFIKQVLQHLLFSGSHGNIRKFCFCAYKGCFTAPYELEVPLKVKLDGEVGNVWSRWYEYYNMSELADCYEASRALREEPNLFPTVYDLPSGGARVGALATTEEDPDANIIVQGTDTSGREVITNHAGMQINGEYLSLKLGSLMYTQVTFGRITGIVKSKTNGYTQLLWVNPDTKIKGFLADYSPLETKPQYRRFRLTTPKCGLNVKVSVLGRIRLKETYSDNDILPFDNLFALSLAGQEVHAQYNNDVQVAAAKSQAVDNEITKESVYKNTQTGKPLEVFRELSAATIRNIV